MTFKSDAIEDIEEVVSETGEFSKEITYTPKGGVAVTIDAIVNRNEPFQEPYVRGENTATCEIIVKASEVTNPQHGDTFTIDGETWEFNPRIMMDREYGDWGFLRINLERSM